MRTVRRLGPLFAIVALAALAACAKPPPAVAAEWQPPPPDVGSAAVQTAGSDGRSHCFGTPALTPAGSNPALLRPAALRPAAPASSRAAWQRCAAPAATERHACLHQLLSACG